MAAVVAMSACRVDSVVTVDMARDGSGTITLEAVADAAVVQAAPGLADDLRFDDAVAAGWTVDGPTATDDGGLRVSLSRTFANVDEANVLLRSISGTAGPLRDVTFSRTGGVGSDGVPDGSGATVELRGSLGIEGGIDAFADPDVLAAVGASPYAADLAAAGVQPADAVSFRLDVHVPGDVTAGADGADEQDGVLSWAAPVDGSTADVTTSFDVAGSTGGWWRAASTLSLVLLVVWCVAGVGLVVVVSNARARRRRAAARRHAMSGTRRRPPADR
ncbi:MAG: hypothetical protein ACO3C1_09055 [Ilumatobacteraceae bacterium]